MAKQKFLLVVVNPFVALDHQGRPTAVVQCDPDFHDPDGHQVGAVVKAELLQAALPIDLKASRTTAIPAKHDVWFECTPEVVKLPIPNVNGQPMVHLLSHYLREMRPSAGGQPALLPADVKTAKLAGVTFADPSTVIVETARLQALRWAKDHDDELPEWAEATAEDLAGAKVKLDANGHLLSYEGLHPSHAAHARFLAAHKAKRATPPERAEPPKTEPEHDGGHQ